MIGATGVGSRHQLAVDVGMITYKQHSYEKYTHGSYTALLIDTSTTRTLS